MDPSGRRTVPYSNNNRRLSAQNSFAFLVITPFPQFRSSERDDGGLCIEVGRYGNNLARTTKAFGMEKQSWADERSPLSAVSASFLLSSLHFRRSSLAFNLVRHRYFLLPLPSKQNVVLTLFPFSRPYFPFLPQPCCPPSSPHASTTRFPSSVAVSTMPSSSVQPLSSLPECVSSLVLPFPSLTSLR